MPNKDLKYCKEEFVIIETKQLASKKRLDESLDINNGKGEGGENVPMLYEEVMDRLKLFIRRKQN